MCGTAAAASGVLTVMRTSSEPACASSLTWMAVPIDVHRVGVGHRLHAHRRVAADRQRMVAPAHHAPGACAAGPSCAGRIGSASGAWFMDWRFTSVRGGPRCRA